MLIRNVVVRICYGTRADPKESILVIRRSFSSGAGRTVLGR